ncbi:MAG: undecaprenyl-diphosphate phosphatase [Candidatus Omnitrophica bacterium]|nr:undecaprenyl-diphosphate phosphatase [Candidatus Omnitrophota bacterium]
MSLVEALFLGALQGLTEFLPVSSSGHLVLVQLLMGRDESMLAFDIAIHWATLIAVFVYFRSDFLKIARDRRLLLRIGVATLPTALMGVFFEDYFESLFGSLRATGIGFIVTAAFLIASVKFHHGKTPLSELKISDALWIGVAQGISIIPSISRSGATILAAMFLGVERGAAVRFSFWIAVPAILGAGLLKLKDGIGELSAYPGPAVAGFLVSGLIGYLTIGLLLKLTVRGKFYGFGYYCLAIGILALFFSFQR